MRFQPVETFWKAYAGLPEAVKAKARKAFQLFQEGAADPPFHPSLRIRKIQGHAGIWEGHVTQQYVFTFHVARDPETDEQVYIFRNIGTHEIYRRP